MSVKTYQQKAVTACQWHGFNQAEIYKFIPAHLRREEPDGLYIQTVLGEEKVWISNFIVRNFKGEFFVAPEEKFLELYEELTPKEEGGEDTK